jgi:hypothetical protein
MAPRRGHFFVEQAVRESSFAEALKRVEEGRG